MSEAIDAIVTWVNGSDPEHIRKRIAAMRSGQSQGLHYIPSGQGKQRFTDNDEVRFCIHSIRKFMPWIRHIFLVTASQRPSFLTEPIRQRLDVTIIDHEEIFRGYESALPTFNSRSIETALYRIRGLAPRYIYFNDDVIAINSLSTTDFFMNGKVILRGQWETLKSYGSGRIFMSGVLNKIYKLLNLRERSMAILPQYRAATIAGLREEYIRLYHVPHPVITDTLRLFFEKKPDVFSENIQYKFRSTHQFVSHSLAAHLEVYRENFLLGPQSDHILVDFSKRDQFKSAIKDLLTGDHKLTCIQNFEKGTSDERALITDFLESRILST